MLRNLSAAAVVGLLIATSLGLAGAELPGLPVAPADHGDPVGDLLGSGCDSRACTKVRIDDALNTNNAFDTVATLGAGDALYWGKDPVWTEGSDGIGSGLDADKLDGLDSAAFLAASGKAADSNLLDGQPPSAFALTGHNHDERYITELAGDGRYLLINGKAADADQLDGVDSAFFLRTTGKAADANLLDGLDNTAFARTIHSHNDLYYAKGVSDANYLPVAGKAADAERLDGVDSATFLRRDQGGSFAGNLGVGTASPLDRLDVRGNVRLNGAVVYDALDASINWGGGAGGNLFFRTLPVQGDPASFNNRMVILNNGNVGIGTVAPTQKLDVAGNIKGTEVYWSTGGALINNQGGSIELGSSTSAGVIPFVDFHYGTGSAQDYNMRIINSANGKLGIDGGNVGIGTTNPTERLEVNGAIKLTPSGGIISRAPRVVHTEDPVSGCPPARAAGTNLFTQTFTMGRAGAVFINAEMIRSYAGRADLFLIVDSVQRDQSLTYTPPGDGNQWFDAGVQWAGALGAGSHTVILRSDKANAWGCGPTWGSIDTIIFE